MKIISDDLRDEKSFDYAGVISDKYDSMPNGLNNIIGVEAGRGFNAGSQFAEKEVENVSIRFAEWILKNDYEKIHGLNWCKKFMSITYSSDELFDKFLNE